MYPIIKPEDSRVHQCDIFKSIRYLESYSEKNDVFELSVLEFPFSIILTQECDLEQNNKERITGEMNDKYLISLLCAPMYNAEHLFAGTHLEHLGLKHVQKGSKDRSLIKSNRDSRYHYIDFEEATPLVPMVIDFKHYFSVPLVHIESKIDSRLGTVSDLYKHLISQRFANFLARIGLPTPE